MKYFFAVSMILVSGCGNGMVATDPWIISPDYIPTAPVTIVAGPTVCPDAHWDASKAFVDTLIVDVVVDNFTGTLEAITVDVEFDPAQLKYERSVAIAPDNWTLFGGSSLGNLARGAGFTVGPPLVLNGSPVTLYQVVFSRVDEWFPSLSVVALYDDLANVDTPCPWPGF